MIFLSIPSAVAMLLAWSVPGMAMAGSAVASIEVFTDVDHPVTASPAFRERVGSSTVVQVFRIDAQARLDRFLSRDLPADPDQARAMATRRIEGLDRARLAQELTETVQGLMQARRYGLDRYPAVVFDGERVVYGITDLDAAWAVFVDRQD